MGGDYIVVCWTSPLCDVAPMPTPKVFRVFADTGVDAVDKVRERLGLTEGEFNKLYITYFCDNHRVQCDVIGH